MLRLLGIAVGAVLAVLWRRARRGQGRPSWSFAFEALAETMRRTMTWLGSLDPPALRRAMALLVGRAHEQRHVRIHEAVLAGRAATWTEPREPRSSRVVVYLHGGGYVAGSARAVGRWTGWYASGAEPIARERALPLDDPRVSPALADPGGLPPLAIHVGDAEVLLDDVRAYAARATGAGVDVTLRVWPDMIHAFPTFGEGFEAANLAVGELGAFLRAS